MRIVDQNSQDSSPRGPSPNPLLFVRLEAHGQELGESSVVLVQDSEGAVAGCGHRACFFDDVAQEDRELEITFEQQCRLEHPSELHGVLNRSERH